MTQLKLLKAFDMNLHEEYLISINLGVHKSTNMTKPTQLTSTIKNRTLGLSLSKEATTRPKFLIELAKQPSTNKSNF
jgi:hypothetical protein